MGKTIAVAGAAAIGDYIFHVNHLPEKGEIVTVTDYSGRLVPGGCAPNIAAGVAALGRAELFYPVGEDFEATGLQDAWTRRGIDCKGLTRVPGVASGCAWMYMQEDGGTMCFGYPGAADTAEPDPPEELPEWVVVAPVLNRYTKGFLEAAIGQGRRTVVTGIGVGGLGVYLGGLTALFVSRREADTLCLALGPVGHKGLSAAYPNLLFYVTEGGRGSRLYQGGRMTKIPPVQADVLTDFTGAGDSFTAGTVSALAAGIDPERAGWYGAAMASFVIERLGGQCEMPGWAQLEQRLHDQFPDRF